MERVFLTNGYSEILTSLLILGAAFLISGLVKFLSKKGLSKIKFLHSLEPIEENRGEKESIINIISNLLYLLVFLMFMPEVLGRLGLESIISPINKVIEGVSLYIPNIIVAGIVLIVGVFIAKIVRQLLVPILDKLKVNKLQEKAGIIVGENERLSYVIAYIIYVLIIIPIIIAVLSILRIDAISTPAMNVLTIIFNFIPYLIFSVIIITFGVLIANFISGVIAKIVGVSGIDNKISGYLPKNSILHNINLSKVIGGITKFIVILLFSVEALNVLNLEVLSGIGETIIIYIPTIVTAVLLCILGLIVAEVVEKLLFENASKGIITLVKGIIYVVVSFMILNHLGVAKVIVNSSFIMIVGALAISSAISFGIGGVTFASNMLKKLEDNIDKK